MTADSDPIPGVSRATPLPLPLDLGAIGKRMTPASPLPIPQVFMHSQGQSAPQAEPAPGPRTPPACPTA